MKIEVYSDGSGMTKATPGGYGFVVIVDGVKRYEGSGHMEFATNNDCEMQGAIEGLASVNKFISEHINEVTSLLDVTLVSDSQIILGWASKKLAFKQEEKIDKYKRLSQLMDFYGAKTRWVKGHSGEPYQERCDKLANAARLNEAI